MVRYCNNGTMSDYECIVVVGVHVSMTHTFLYCVLFLVSRETVWDWPASLKTLTRLTLICSARKSGENMQGTSLPFY